MGNPNTVPNVEGTSTGNPGKHAVGTWGQGGGNTGWEPSGTWTVLTKNSRARIWNGSHRGKPGILDFSEPASQREETSLEGPDYIGQRKCFSRERKGRVQGEPKNSGAGWVEKHRGAGHRVPGTLDSSGTSEAERIQ